jgi:phosphate transport system protein
MSADLRRAFHESLNDLDSRLTSLFGLVVEAIDAVRRRGPSGPHAMVALADQEARIDVLVAEIEDIVQWHLARQQAVGRDLRLLVTALRIAPELERSHDLVVHVARLAPSLADAAGTSRTAIAEMIDSVAEMWRQTATCYHRRDPSAAARLKADDKQINEMHRRLLKSISSAEADCRTAIDVALVDRFLERLGDHAVHLAERVRFLAVGERPDPDADVHRPVIITGATSRIDGA